MEGDSAALPQNQEDAKGKQDSATEKYLPQPQATKTETNTKLLVGRACPVTCSTGGFYEKIPKLKIISSLLQCPVCLSLEFTDTGWIQTQVSGSAYISGGG